MNELIRVTYDREQRPTGMGRDLHEALGMHSPALPPRMLLESLPSAMRLRA